MRESDKDMLRDIFSQVMVAQLPERGRKTSFVWRRMIPAKAASDRVAENSAKSAASSLIECLFHWYLAAGGQRPENLFGLDEACARLELRQVQKRDAQAPPKQRSARRRRTGVLGAESG